MIRSHTTIVIQEAIKRNLSVSYALSISYGPSLNTILAMKLTLTDMNPIIDSRLTTTRTLFKHPFSKQSINNSNLKFTDLSLISECFV